MSMASPAAINVERPHKEPISLRVEVADAVRRAKSWAELLHIADEASDQFRIRQARALYRKGREIYPEHENEFQMGENFIRTRRQAEREARYHAKVGREVAKVLKEARRWQDVVDAASMHADRGEIRYVVDLCMAGERAYPDHKKDFIELQALMLSEIMHIQKAGGYKSVSKR